MGVPGVLAFLGTEHPPWPRFGGSQGILFLGEGFRGRSAERRSHGSGALRGRSGLDDPGRSPRADPHPRSGHTISCCRTGWRRRVPGWAPALRDKPGVTVTSQGAH